MPDKKLTDNEIVKALECISGKAKDLDCDKCTFDGAICTSFVAEKALYLINRLQAENEGLKGKVKVRELIINKLKTGSNAYVSLTSDSLEYLKIKAEAYKEFAERLLEERLAVVTLKDVTEEYSNGYHDALCFVEEQTNNLLKELVGENDG